MRTYKVEFDKELSSDLKEVLFVSIENMGGTIIEEVHSQAHQVEERIKSEIEEVLNFVGIWRLRNGGYAKILSFDDITKLWTAKLYQEDGVEAGIIYYDMFGNPEDGNKFLMLDERKRGEEKGWPNI